MKKVISLLILFFLIFVSGCGTKQQEEKQKITIYYETYGGIFTEELPIEYEVGTINLPSPQKENYIFLNWTLEDGTIITSDYIFEKTITIYANWERIGKKYQIYYDLDGGNFSAEYPREHIFGYDTLLVAPEKEYHKFLGWYDNESFEGNVYEKLPLTNNRHITLYAKWQDVAPYEDIIYYLDGGVLPSDAPTRYIPSKEYQLVDPVKDGYYFRGFYDNAEFTNESIKQIEKTNTGALTLYAKWEKATLENTYISFIGDSISTYLGYIPDGYACFYPYIHNDVVNVEDTWWHKVITGLNAKLCMNNSYSGSKVSGGAASSASNLDRVKNIINQASQKPDVLVILIGANDCSYAVKNDEFQRAYQTMINLVKQISPNTKIYLCTLTADVQNATIEERLNDYNEIIRNIAVNNNCKVIELANIINYDNANTYLGDSVHPNKAGMEKMAEEVIRVIKEDYQ